ncbi:probable CCR4-associated factor 1 homolog 11 [Neltuma alba]|uniref:probable CCR4-associated factor 1 homolog 11 n=1 Tax=Neltuma alba TaxID=207710 RepID=UPI0010A3DA17|nr:probable CCR4-associated factor 1 homolog 11 [Prosopis alba]
MGARFFGPKIYDMKHIIKFCNGLYGGLERVAGTLNADRVAGKNHQAGFDSLLTLQTFMSELSLIRAVIPTRCFASFDTEFPGTIITPDVDNRSYSKVSPPTNCSFMKANVGELKIIQLGLTFSDSNRNLTNFGTPNGYIWQFNFSDFDAEHDCHNVESIQLLEKQGIDFVKNKKEGIPSWLFLNFVLNSGLLFNPHLTWVTFHSFYDFGFMIKLLIGRQLPPNVHLFRQMVARFFGPKIYDMKHIIKFCNGLYQKNCNGLYGGLERVARTLSVDRVAGKNHQAGSDSFLTLQTIMKLKDLYFNGNLGLQKFQGIFYGLEVNPMIQI